MVQGNERFKIVIINKLNAFMRKANARRKAKAFAFATITKKKIAL